MKPEQKETLPLPEAVAHLLEECRMVLPGLQALLGFHFIAIFNVGFGEKLTSTKQRLASVTNLEPRGYGVVYILERSPGVLRTKKGDRAGRAVAEGWVLTVHRAGERRMNGVVMIHSGGV
jgi:hypothetical protein